MINCTLIVNKLIAVNVSLQIKINQWLIGDLKLHGTNTSDFEGLRSFATGINVPK